MLKMLLNLLQKNFFFICFICATIIVINLQSKCTYLKMNLDVAFKFEKGKEKEEEKKTPCLVVQPNI